MNNIKNSKKLKIFIFLAQLILLSTLHYIHLDKDYHYEDFLCAFFGAWLLCASIRWYTLEISKDHYHTIEKKQKIYDNKGNIIGYIGTGEYKEDYENAKISVNKKKAIDYFAMSIYSIVFTVAIIIHCCIPYKKHPIWFGITLGIITLYTLNRYIINQKFREHVNFYSNIFYYSSIISVVFLLNLC